MAEKVREIGELKKNGSSSIKVTVADYKGRPYADVRTYYRDDQDAWAPTKKGVAFHTVEEIDRTIGLLREARDELARRMS